MSCAQCHKPHVLRGTDTPSCKGHWKSDPSKPCGQPRMDGQEICRKHGGKALQNLVAAERRVKIRELETEISKVLVRDDVAPVTDPYEQMALLAGEARDFTNALASKLVKLETIRYSSAESGTEQIRAEIVLYERALDRTAKFLDILIKSGFEERRVRMSEDMGRLIAMAFQQFIGSSAMAFTEDQLEQVSVVLPPILRAIGSGEQVSA